MPPSPLSNAAIVRPQQVQRTASAQRYPLSSRARTTSSAAAVLAPVLDTAARNGSRSRATTTLGSSARTVAVRGESRTSAISPNESPAPSDLGRQDRDTGDPADDDDAEQPVSRDAIGEREDQRREDDRGQGAEHRDERDRARPADVEREHEQADEVGGLGGRPRVRRQLEAQQPPVRDDLADGVEGLRDTATKAGQHPTRMGHRRLGEPGIRASV